MSSKFIIFSKILKTQKTRKSALHLRNIELKNLSKPHHKNTVNLPKTTLKFTLQRTQIQARIKLRLPRATTQKTPHSSNSEIGK